MIIYSEWWTRHLTEKNLEICKSAIFVNQESGINKQFERGGHQAAAWPIYHTDLAIRGGLLQQAIFLPRGPELHHRWPRRIVSVALVFR